MKGYIYKITNKLNGKSYIGKTNDLEKRWRYHLYALERNGQTPLYRAMRKYGVENFEFSVIETIECGSKEELNQRLCELEKHYIENYQTKSPNGYNLTDGGEGLSGMKFSKSHRKKIADALKGRTKTEEHRQKLSEIRKRLKIPPPNKGKRLSEETKAKISRAKKGQAAGEKNPFYSKKHSPEFIEWIKEYNRQWAQENYEHLVKSQPNRIAVHMRDKETGEIIQTFDSLKQAAKWIAENTKYKGDVSTISDVIKGKKELAYGYKWIAVK